LSKQNPVLKPRKPTLTERYKKWTMKEKYDFYGIKTIGYLDIETSGLNADFDIMLSWANCIRDVKTGKTKIEYDFIEKKDFDQIPSDTIIQSI